MGIILFFAIALFGPFGPLFVLLYIPLFGLVRWFLKNEGEDE
jgi:hypothetical protein